MKKNQAPAHLRFAVVAVDAVVFAIFDDSLHVLIDRVGSESVYTGMEAFPGGIIKEQENTDEALMRVLSDKVAVSPAYSEQLYTFSDVHRDKRNRVVAVAHLCFVRPDAAAAYTHDTARFVSIAKLPKLAYDHTPMFRLALKRLQGKLAYTNVAQFLLPRHFTLTELQTVYELVLGYELDKRNFRKKILALEIVKETGKMQEGVKNRPAALYEFANQKMEELPLLI